MNLTGTLLLASFIAAPTTSPRFTVSAIELTGKATDDSIESSQSIDENHLDYDELLSSGRELLAHPRVKEIYRAEIKRQKRDFVAQIAKMGKAGAALNLTPEDFLRYNRISLGHDAKGPRVRMQFVRTFDYKAKPPVPIDYLVQTAHKDAKGEVHIESNPAPADYATGVAE